MTKHTKIALISLGGVVAAGAVASATAIATTLQPQKVQSNLAPVTVSGDYKDKNESINKPIEVEATNGVRIGIEKLFSSSTTRAEEQKYKLTLINDDNKGTVHFVDDLGQNAGNQIDVYRGQQVHVRVDVKDEYKDSLTVVNFWVYNPANPNYSLGVKKVDDNNYHFVMPEGEFADEFYGSATELKASITYGQKALGSWEFDFNTKHYVYNVTTDNFVFDDVANPNLKMQQYPNGSFVVYTLRLNGHNTIIKNMTIPRNVQFEVVDDSVFDQTTTSSPVLGFAEDGNLDFNGAAGLNRGVRITRRTMSKFHWSSWSQDESILIAGEEFDKVPSNK